MFKGLSKNVLPVLAGFIVARRFFTAAVKTLIGTWLHISSLLNAFSPMAVTFSGAMALQTFFQDLNSC